MLVLPRALARWRAPRPVQGERRILGIYHFQEHAGYLGDVMEFLVVLNTLREEHGLQEVDVCYIDDPSNPNQPITRARIESSAGMKDMMVSLRALLPAPGTTYRFNSDAAFEIFFRSHYRQYRSWPRYGFLHSWPSRVNYTRIADHGSPYPNTYAPLDRFYHARGYLPKISCPPAAMEWAHSFIRKHVSPAVPITAQVRFNPDSQYRNTELGPWKTFFTRMQARLDIKFIVICRREEIVPELRGLSNVVYAKDHGSDVLQDLALVQASHFSMFPDSGFCTFPWFCGLPSLYFGRTKFEFPQRRMQDAAGDGLRFLSPFQRRIWGEYTAASLDEAFWSLWKDLDAAGWKNPHGI